MSKAILAIVAGLLLSATIATYESKEQRHDKLVKQLCGLTTGLQKWQYIGNTLYCRTASGDLQRPRKVYFRRVQKVDDKGKESINYVPLRTCIKEKK